jgi:hypothetical protein
MREMGRWRAWTGGRGISHNQGTERSGGGGMDRSKWVAIATGAVSLALAIGYLLLVQLLDFRGEMLPAPMGWLGAIG